MIYYNYLLNELFHHIGKYGLLSMGRSCLCKKYINRSHQCRVTVWCHLFCILFTSPLPTPQDIERISTTRISYVAWDTLTLLYYNIMFNNYEYLDLHIFWNGKDLHPYWAHHLDLLPYFWTTPKVFQKGQSRQKYFLTETHMMYLYSSDFTSKVKSFK